MVQPQVCPPHKKKWMRSSHDSWRDWSWSVCFFFKEIYLPEKKWPPAPAGQLTFKNFKKAKAPKKRMLRKKTKKKSAPLFFPKRGKPGVLHPKFPLENSLTPFFVGRGYGFLEFSIIVLVGVKNTVDSSSNFGSSFWKDGGWLLEKRKKNLWVNLLKKKYVHFQKGEGFYIRLPKTLKPNKTTKS